MLQQLTIRNFAIIDDLTMEVLPGFLTMTGETGAGKSIIIEALGLLLGERANSVMVRHGASKAFIEGVFSYSQRQQAMVENLLGPVEEPLLIVRRDVELDGKSAIRINGRISTNSLAKNLMRSLVDIHSQHDSLYLIDEKNHLMLLDTYAHNDLAVIKEKYRAAYLKWQGAVSELTELEKSHFSQEQIELLEFQCQEIEAAHIVVGEWAQLEIDKKRITQYETIARQVQSTLAFLKGDQGVLPLLYQSQKALSTLHNDAQFSAYAEQLAQLYHQLDAVTDGIDQDFTSLQLDEGRMQEINDRLYIYGKLKRKYGQTDQEILSTLESNRRQLQLANDREILISRLRKRIDEYLADVNTIGAQLTQTRVTAARRLEKKVEVELSDLYLKHAQFKVIFNQASPSKDGLDKLEFYVSVNPGQAPLPLGKVASGGEVSRLMLALKVIFNRLYGVETTIFDEVDTGVSGEIASAMGRKMKTLAMDGQVIAITHLPQVAVTAPHQYHVSKEITNNSTRTIIRLLAKDERIEVIAKMLSGAKLTLEARANAQQLLNNVND